MRDNPGKYEDGLEFFIKAKVMSLKQLADRLSCSERTVQRHLKKWRTYTSYNKNGRYYVLPAIPRFDEDGLWRYQGIFFSRHGNLKQTLIALVNHFPAGLTAAEAGALVGVSLRSFLAQSHNIQPLRREKITGRFVYFSQEEALFSQQKQKRQDDDSRLKLLRLPTDTEAVIILVERIKHPELRRIGKTNGILSPALPERNPENTPGAAARSRRWRLPQHAAAACQSGSKLGVARQCAVWTCGSGWVRMAFQRFAGAKASGRPVSGKLGGTISNGISQREGAKYTAAARTSPMGPRWRGLHRTRIFLGDNGRA
jgi:hypothetical protein